MAVEGKIRSIEGVDSVEEDKLGKGERILFKIH